MIPYAPDTRTSRILDQLSRVLDATEAALALDRVRAGLDHPAWAQVVVSSAHYAHLHPRDFAERLEMMEMLSETDIPPHIRREVLRRQRWGYTTSRVLPAVGLKP